MSEKRNLTIKDIAKLANVSPGTVDRVIHNRGRVSEKSYAKVSVVLEEIQYKPNVFAQSLKKQKSCAITTLLPHKENDGYWHSAHQGISKAVEDLSHYGMDVQVLPFNGKDPIDFASKSNEALAAGPDGILVTPVFFKESMDFLRSLEEKQVPYITFNTMIPELNARCVIGQDLKQSGRMAANLIDHCRSKMSNLLIIHLDEDPENAPHMIQKEKGFREYIEAKYPTTQIRRIVIPHRDPESINNLLDKHTGGLLDVTGAFITTAKANLVAYPIKSRFQDCVVVGYDLTAPNIDGIRSGIIDFLINQNPFQAAYEGLTKLVDILLLDKQIEREILLPLDIITKENLDSYPIS